MSTFVCSALIAVALSSGLSAAAARLKRTLDDSLTPPSPIDLNPPRR